MLPVTTTNPALSVMTRAPTTPSPNIQSSTTNKRQPTWMKTSDLDTKRPTQISWPKQVNMPDDIGKYIVCDTEEVTRIDWTEFVRWRRGRGYLILCRRWRTRRGACCGNTSIGTHRSC